MGALLKKVIAAQTVPQIIIVSGFALMDLSGANGPLIDEH